MCFGAKPQAPPAPPPPAPPINPIEIGASEDAQVRGRRKKLGVEQLQIPLASNLTSGLGIPRVGM
jgi:hypothetical protein